MVEELAPGIAFGLAGLLLAAGAVQLAGCFPLSRRPPALTGGAGLAAIALGLGALAALLAAALLLAWTLLSWPVAVIAGGLGLLAGPLAFQALPRRLADTPGGMATVALLLLLAAGLLLLTTPGRI